MALNTSDMSLDEQNAYYAQKKASDLAFQQQIATPQGMADYNNTVAQRWSDIQNGVNGYEKESGFDSFMDKLTTGLVNSIPLIYGAALTGGALGLFGDAAATGAAAGGSALAGGTGAAGADVALGSMGIDSAALQSLSGLGGMTSGAGAVGTGLGAMGAAGGAEAGLGGLAAGIPNAGVVTVGAPAAAGGLASAGLGSAGSAVGLGAAATGALPYLDSVGQGAASSSTPSLGQVASGIKGVGGVLGGLGSLGSAASGLGSIYGAYNDGKNNAADTDFYKNQLATMTGMYQPGTPEATLMEQQMNAKDAAAGRNSQYGTRAVNLAGALAQQRANIMTSSAYQHTADMYRGKTDSNANSWLNLLGQAGQGGANLGNLFTSASNGISGISNGLSSLFGGNTTTQPPNMGTSVAGAVDNFLY